MNEMVNLKDCENKIIVFPPSTLTDPPYVPTNVYGPGLRTPGLDYKGLLHENGIVD